MKITTTEVRSVVHVLDDIIDEYKKSKPKGHRDWRTYEQQRTQRIRGAIKNLEPLVDEAISQLKVTKGETRGKKPILPLKKRVELLLLKHLFAKSNREMADMLVLFSLLSDIDVSYKTVERLYSDEQVFLVLLNLHAILLKKRGIDQPDCAGDGTGYSLTIKKHYASEAQKLKDKANDIGKKASNKSKKTGVYIFSFKIMDLDTRMYVGHGTSFRSEKEAYRKAVQMTENTGMGSIRLDRYYSGQSNVKDLTRRFGKDVLIYIIPKKNATIKGPLKWKKIMHDFVNNTPGYLGEYYRRNQSESGFSEDKRRFGWRIPQRLVERVETFDSCTSLWHNMFWMENG